MRVCFVAFLLSLIALSAPTVVKATQLRRADHGGGGGMSSKGSGTKKGGGGGRGGGNRHHRKSRQHKDCGETKKPHKHGKFDMGIRFNKFEMEEDYIGHPVKLDWRNYPLDESMAYKLSHYSNVESLVMPDDYEVNGVCIEHYIDAVGGYPVFPESHPNSPFWDELQEVVDAQELRLRGQIPSFFVLPDLWKRFSAAEVAEAVHDEVRRLWNGASH